MSVPLASRAILMRSPSADGAVGPARAAVLRDVLVERGRQEVDAILVPPRKIRRVSGLRLDEQVVGRDGGGVAAPHKARLLGLLLVPQLRLAGRLGREGKRSNRAVEHLRARRDSAVSRAIDFCRRVGAEPLEWPGRGRRASGVILRGRARRSGSPAHGAWPSFF